MKKISQRIDWLISWQGRITCLLIIPLLFIVCFEVFMRYGLNKPTIYGFELTSIFYALHFFLGLSFMDYYDGHVKVDVFVARLPARPRKTVKIIAYLVLSLPICFGYILGTGRFALQSTIDMERSWTSWAPYIWPFKILICLSFVLLFLQELSNLIKTGTQTE